MPSRVSRSAVLAALIALVGGWCVSCENASSVAPEDALLFPKQFIIQTDKNDSGAFATAYLLWQLQSEGESFTNVPEHERVNINDAEKLEELHSNSAVQTFVDETYTAIKFKPQIATAFSNALYTISGGAEETDFSDGVDPIALAVYLRGFGIKSVFYAGTNERILALLTVYETEAPETLSALKASNAFVSNETAQLSSGQYGILVTLAENNAFHYLLMHRTASISDEIYEPAAGFAQRPNIHTGNVFHTLRCTDWSITPWSTITPITEKRRSLASTIVIDTQ